MVHYKVLGSIAHIHLDRPQAIGALSLDMVQSLCKFLMQAQRSDEIKAIFIDGSSERGFCSGGDVKSLILAHQESPQKAIQIARDYFYHEYKADSLIHMSRKPVVCWGHGVVMGGGVGLMIGASHRVATETTLWAMPEISIGLYPDVGGAWFLNRLPSPIAKFIALTGARLNANDLVKIGFADYLAENNHREELLKKLSNCSFSEDFEQNKAKIDNILLELERTREFTFSSSQLEEHWDEITFLFRSHSIDRVVELCELHRTESAWMRSSLDQLLKGSPTSLRVIDAHLKRCQQKSLAEVMQLDWHLSLSFLKHKDFAEGVRAVLIDKDQHPRWNPAQLSNTPLKVIDEHFQLHDNSRNPADF